MIFFFSTPTSQYHYHVISGMPVLISYAHYNEWIDHWIKSFSHLLIDSGAYSELNSGIKINIDEYKSWSERWQDTATAIAGLDDISGDWKKSWSNFEKIPWGFPTWHDTDPKEYLKDVIALAQQRKQWIAIGLKPPRQGKEEIVKWFLDEVSKVSMDIHIHGWACQIYEHLGRFNSFDSINWYRPYIDILKQFPWLTPGEALEIQIKKYKRKYGKHIDPKVRDQVTLLKGFGISKKEILERFNLTEKEYHGI